MASRRGDCSAFGTGTSEWIGGLGHALTCISALFCRCRRLCLCRSWRRCRYPRLPDGPLTSSLTSPGNPLGAQFTLSPSPRNDNHFLSFSIEPTCHRLPFVPHSRRAKPPQAYLLAKQVHYLDDTPAFSWTLPALVDLEREFGISVVGGMVDDDEVTSAAVHAAGLTNLGRLGKMEFYEELATSFVLVGVGRPRISPSPWDALCMGLPVSRRHRHQSENNTNQPRYRHLHEAGVEELTQPLSLSTRSWNGTRTIRVIDRNGTPNNGT